MKRLVGTVLMLAVGFSLMGTPATATGTLDARVRLLQRAAYRECLTRAEIFDGGASGQTVKWPNHACSEIAALLGHP